jgi:exopolysaccharide production protein ExoZ
LNAKINNIQALRAFAALAVASFHTAFAFPHMRPFGSFGVDVFFVISGYIMARICENNSQFFFRRRVLRIVPPYWTATILLFFAALWFPQLMGSTRPAPNELVKSLLFIPFVKASGLLRPVLFVGWSLNYEMYFYVVLSISLLIFRRRALWLAAGAVTGITLVCAYFQDRSIYARFYGADICLEFVLGILAWFVCRAVADSTARRLRIPMLIVLIASVVMLIAVQGVMQPLHLPRSLPLGGISFVMVASASLLSQGGWDTNAKWLVLIGDASYILYLIHTYGEYFIDRVLARRFHWLYGYTASGYVVSMVFVTALAVLIHLTMERPAVAYLNRRFGGKRKSTEFTVKRVA